MKEQNETIKVIYDGCGVRQGINLRLHNYLVHAQAVALFSARKRAWERD